MIARIGSVSCRCWSTLSNAMLWMMFSDLSLSVRSSVAKRSNPEDPSLEEARVCEARHRYRIKLFRNYLDPRFCPVTWLLQ